MQLVLKSTEICNVRYVLESCINYISTPLVFAGQYTFKLNDEYLNKLSVHISLFLH